MIDEFAGTVQISTTPQATWAVIQDPAALGRALPDCESITPDGSGGLKVVVAIKQMFMTVRVDLHVTYHDLDEPHHLRLDLDGVPRGLGGALHLSVPIEITAIPTGAKVDYKGSLELQGMLTSFRKQVREGLQAQLDRLVRNIEREAKAPPAG
ncbi:MAG TPA: SRPBCC domain-containing protein [Candidatus Limnocylindrales bacterium]|nr:SRPBCC domain-containing protein [Candidatus Limnocylindrales bacterium]